MSIEIDAINRFLAEKVMGWAIFRDNYVTERGYIYGWNPYHSLSDCNLLLEWIEKNRWQWCWDNFDDQYTFEMGPIDFLGKYHAVGKTRTAALCECVAKAYGYNQG